MQHDEVKEQEFYSREGHRVGNTMWIEQGPHGGLKIISEEKECEEEKIFIE